MMLTCTRLRIRVSSVLLAFLPAVINSSLDLASTMAEFDWESEPAGEEPFAPNLQAPPSFGVDVISFLKDFEGADFEEPKPGEFKFAALLDRLEAEEEEKKEKKKEERRVKRAATAKAKAKAAAAKEAAAAAWRAQQEEIMKRARRRMRQNANDRWRAKVKHTDAYKAKEALRKRNQRRKAKGLPPLLA